MDECVCVWGGEGGGGGDGWMDECVSMGGEVDG